MLEAIQKLSNSEVFSITLENEPEKTKHWFRATDLCEILFTKGNAQRYVNLHCKDWQYREFKVGKGRPALYVCESGVYRLILRSKAPIALEFQDWLTEEVIPKLRNQGLYITQKSDESLVDYVAREKALLAENQRLLAENQELMVVHEDTFHAVSRSFIGFDRGDYQANTIERKKAVLVEFENNLVKYLSKVPMEED